MSVAEGPATDGASRRAAPSRQSPVPRLATSAVGLAVLAVVVVVAARHGEGRRFGELLKAARPAWLLLGAALQTATYACAGGVWWIALRRSRSPQPLGRLVLLSVAKLFADEALPAGGVTGTLVFVRAIVRRGTPPATAAAAFIVNLLGFYGSFVLAAASALAAVWVRHGVNPVFVAMAAALLVLAVSVPSLLFVLRRHGRSSALRRVARFRVAQGVLEAFASAPRERIRDRAALGGSLALQLTTVLLDSATLAVMLAAIGHPARVDVVFASFVFAMIAENVGLVPGGLGTFEGTCVWLLHASGVAIEPALAATLLLRGFTFWLPLLPGAILIHRELGADGRRALTA